MLLAVEVSWTVHREDVERALRRTAIAQKAGFVAIPLVGGREWADEPLKQQALQEGVLCVEDRRVTPMDWDGVVVRWRPE